MYAVLYSTKYYITRAKSLHPIFVIRKYVQDLLGRTVGGSEETNSCTCLSQFGFFHSAQKMEALVTKTFHVLHTCFFGWWETLKGRILFMLTGISEMMCH